MAEVGQQLGSDVRFFFVAPAACVTGRGEQVRPVQVTGRRWIVLVNPGFPVETKWAYQQLAATRRGVRPLSEAVQQLGHRSALDWSEVIPPVENDFETPVFAQHPVLAQIKSQLLGLGAEVALLSGSGATTFGVFGDEAAAQQAALVCGRNPQIASRMLPIFVLGPVLEQFPIASVIDLARRTQLGEAGIARMRGRQNRDGGSRYWDTNARTSPYLSVYVTFALLEGKKAGFKVEEQALRRALNYLESFITYGESTPLGPYYDNTSRALALGLLSREKRGAELFDSVYARRDEVPLYARMQLLSAAHAFGRAGPRDALLKDLRARVTETARTAHFAERVSEAESEGLQLLMHSDVQTDATAPRQRQFGRNRPARECPEPDVDASVDQNNALRESEKRKSAILEAALDCIVTVDAEGNVIEFNPAAERTFGYSRAEILHQRMSEFIVPPRLRDAHDDGMKHYLATGEGPVLRKRIEITAMRKNGEEFPVELAVIPVDQDDHPIFTAYLRYISAARHAQQAIKDSESRYRMVVENLSEIVFQADDQLRLSYLNPAWTEITMAGIDESLGHARTDFVPGDERERIALFNLYWLSVILGLVILEVVVLWFTDRLMVRLQLWIIERKRQQLPQQICT